MLSQWFNVEIAYHTVKNKSLIINNGFQKKKKKKRKHI